MLSQNARAYFPDRNGASFSVLLAFHKPFGVLSQFTPDGSTHRPLADFQFPPKVYPLGRLDAESEGLLLLTDERDLNARLLDPERGHWRVYWALVERRPSAEALNRLAQGVSIGGHATRPARAWILDPPPTVAPRKPPVRYRKNVEDVWMALALTEGKNHQVRKMTAAVGHPTLRLLRVQIGGLELGELLPGNWRELDANDRELIFRATEKP